MVELGDLQHQLADPRLTFPPDVVGHRLGNAERGRVQIVEIVAVVDAVGDIQRPAVPVEHAIDGSVTGDHEVGIAGIRFLLGQVMAGSPPAPGTKPLMYFRRTYGTWED